MKIDWTPIDDALRRMRGAGLTLPIWWRDDDAIAETPMLHRLTRMSRDLGLPVHLAIIPGHLETSLVDYVSQHRELIPVVHGWQHRNHSPAGQKKAEFGTTRPGAKDDLERGFSLMQDRFGPRLLSLFVPPWNRIAAQNVQLLASIGYRGLSTFTPRSAPLAAQGVAQLNTHVDPIDWRGGRSLLPPARIISECAALLIDRIEGRSDAVEPFGYLTHHLVHDPAIWTFSEKFIQRILDGGAVACDLAPHLAPSR